MFEDLIENISVSLEKYNIPYIIIGGQAVLVYGRARMTNDIDFIIGNGLNNLDDIKKICTELKLTNLKEDDESFTTRTMVLPAEDTESMFRVDFIFSFTDFEEAAINRGKDIFVKTRSVKFASVEDLIIFKIYSGRPEDISDVKSVILMNPAYDKDYVMNWLKKFDEGSDIKYTQIYEEILSPL